MTSLRHDYPSVTDIAALLDHAILKPELTREAVDAELALAAEFGVFSVCVRPSDVSHAVQVLTGTGVATGTVIGFPHGTTSTAGKVAEVRQAAADGAVEFDMVINIGWLRSGLIDLVTADIAAVVAAAEGKIVKVILETVFLDDDQIVAGSVAAEAAGAHFVKTSTGFAGGGATVHDLQLMRSAVSEHVQVKASGGVRGLDTLLEMQDVGVTRFGTSASATILEDLRHRVEHGSIAKQRLDESSY